MQTFSSVFAKVSTSGVISNFALYDKPLVQAKIDAIGFVDV